MEMNPPFRQKLFYFFPVVFCFCLPFGSLLLSGIILLWAFVSLFNIEAKQLKKGFLNRNLWLFYAFFLLTAISAFASQNEKEAASAIEIKWSFVVFPYFFFCFHWPPGILRRCLASFVSGCFFACLYLIGRAALFAYGGHPEYFFYTLFSDLIHASYFSMYLVMAIAIVILFYSKWFPGQKNILYSSYFFISVFVASIFLCSSKLGLITFFICIPLLILFQWRARLTAGRIALLAGAVAGMLLITIVLFPGTFGRFRSLGSVSMESIDKASSESTTVRILIWQQALQIIKSHFFLGTGVGDANDALYRAYEQNGLTGAFEHRFNAHNQYLQTFIGMGIAGFILLLLITVGQLIKALVRRNFLLLLFALLATLNFMVESMLQTAAGVLFFCFFFCFFNLTDQKKLALE